MTAWVQALNTAESEVPLGPPYLHFFHMVWLLQWGTPPKEIYSLTLSRAAGKPAESAKTLVGVWKHFRG